MAKFEKTLQGNFSQLLNRIENGIVEEVPLRGFEAPKITTYLIYRTGYNANRFLKNE